MTEAATIVLPRGHLELGARLRARVPAEGAAARGLAEVGSALGRLDSWLIAPAKSELAAGEVVFELAPERPGTLAADQAFALHFRDALAHPTLVTGLLAFLCGCWRDVAAMGMGDALWGIGPATLRYTPGRQDPWRIVAVPQPKLSAADWAQADERVWLWTAPEVVLGGPAGDAGMAWTLGTALEQALGGDGDSTLARLPAHERFRRVLAGRGARPALLDRALQAALPPSFVEERAQLLAALAELTAPQPERRPQGEALLELAGALLERIGARRVASRWAWHGRPEAARAVIEAQARSAPSRWVPWTLLARLDEERGDFAAALTSAKKALEEDEQGDGEREYVSLLGRIAGRAPAAQLLEALTALDGREPPVDDVTRVFLAHLEARHAAAPGAAMQRLTGGFTTPWGELLALVVTARIAAGSGDWVLVSRTCKQARERLAAQGGGGEPGRYLGAFVDVLDGIANHGAVALLNDPSYLVDAFEALSRALPAARAVGAGELGDDAGAWLAVVARDAGKHGARFAPLLLGAQALMPAGASATRASVPWYDEPRLFPRAGRRGDG
ncbi:MAG: hypothetical protein IT370_38050 [Deltaproteobacteria bacterium]|nr:hypothetical protein [Deltaproteobacteria bacterium]